MLIAASVRQLSHVIAFSLLLCAGYGIILFQGVVQTGSLAVGHLLGVPVLLVMATLYGLALQTIGAERQQKTLLMGSIEALKETEQALQVSRDQLEVRIKVSRVISHGQMSRSGRRRRNDKASSSNCMRCRRWKRLVGLPGGLPRIQLSRFGDREADGRGLIPPRVGRPNLWAGR
jgi:hypothetical protein